MVSSCGYEKPCISENRSWTLCMLTLTAFLTAMLAYCTNSVLVDTEPPAAKAFRDHVQQDLIVATVTGSGYSYVGTCTGLKRDDSGRGDQVCAASQDVNNMCRDLLNDEFPRIGGSDSGRRLSTLDDESDDTEEPGALDDESEDSEERRLRGHGGDSATAEVCYNDYVPWALVSFQATNGQGAYTTFTRCSYRMGTRSNSHVLAFNETQLEVARLASLQAINIWNVSGRESLRCIVGYAPLAALDDFVESSGSPIPGVWALMTFFGSISACSILGLLYEIAFKKDEGDEEEDGESKSASKAEEYENLEGGDAM